MKRNRQLITKIGRNILQMKPKVHMIAARQKILKLYRSLKTKKKILNPRITQWLNKRRDLTLASWGFLFFIGAQLSTIIVIYASIEEYRDPIQKIEEVYPRKIRRLELFNGNIIQLKPGEMPLGHQSHLVLCVTPQNQDELTNLVKFSYAHRYCIISGSYTVLPSTLPISRDEAEQSINYIIFNMDKMNNYQIDTTNNKIILEMGCKCSDINKALAQEGFEDLFFPEMNDYTVHRIVNQNIPLKMPFMHNLAQNVLNIDIVSPEGSNFRTAPEVQHHGAVPNLNSFFLGSQGRYGIPSKVILKIQRKQKLKIKYFRLKNLDNNQAVLTLRKIKKVIDQSSNKIQSQIIRQGQNLIVAMNDQFQRVLIDKSWNIEEILNKQIKEQIDKNNVSGIFSVDWSIAEGIILKKELSGFNFSLNGNILRVKVPIQQIRRRNRVLENSHIEDLERNEEMRRLISNITLQGGILVWCKDEELFHSMKTMGQGIQIGVELMKRMYQIRLTMDPRKTFFARDRQEIYFIKSLYRKISEAFW